MENLELFPPAIIDVAEAGQAAKVRTKLSLLIKGLSASTFDIMDLLHEVKTKNFYLPKHDTFATYAKTLDLKIAKSYYLVRVKEVLLAAGISRDEYEPIGISKLRVISKLDPVEQIEIVKSIVAQAKTAPLNTVKELVATALGQTGDDAFVWLNISLKHSAREIVRQALTLMKNHLGSSSQDADGNFKDASDGKAIEMICADYLAGATYDPEVGL